MTVYCSRLFPSPTPLGLLLTQNWKARVSAYEELKDKFTTSPSENDAVFTPFLDNPGLYKKIVADTNVVAQEQAIHSLVAFLRYGGTNACLRTRSGVLPTLAEKGLGSSRAGTKTATTECLLWFIELDVPDPVVEDVVVLLGHRTPKVIAANLKCLTEMVAAFGKTINPQPVFKTMGKLLAHADKNVRAEAMAFIVEAHRWHGQPLLDALMPGWGLKPVQQKELDEKFAANVAAGKPTQPRLLRSQQEVLSTANANGISENDDMEVDAEEEQDPLALVEAKDVLSQIPASFHTDVASSKWKERKEALEAVVPILQSGGPKLQDGDYGELMRAMAKVVHKDANVQCVQAAAAGIEVVALGLGPPFAKYRFTLTAVLERTKEKKASVSEVLAKALDAIALQLPFSEIVEDTLPFVAHKTPQVRIESLGFLLRLFSTVKEFPAESDINQVIKAALKTMGDTQAPVREISMQLLGTAKKLIGERAFENHFKGVDDIRKTKINEFYEKAEVSAKPKPKPQPKAQPRAPPASSSGAGSSSGPPSNKRPSVATPGQRKLVRPGANVARKPFTSASAAGGPSSGFGSSASAQPASSGYGQSSSGYGQSSSGYGQSGRGGLMKHSLKKSSSPNLEASPVVSADAEELEELRNAKEAWAKEKEMLRAAFEAEKQKFAAEKQRLLDEINSLQHSKADILEQHTKDAVSFKSKETQFARMQGDLQAAYKRIKELESSPTSSHSPQVKLEPRERTVSPSVDAEASFRELNLDGGSGSGSAGFGSGSGSGTQSSHQRTRSSEYGGRGLSPDFRSSSREHRESAYRPQESWQRAAEVTNQLKARIEAMKARQKLY